MKQLFITTNIRGVHGSVRVEFVSNPEPTCSHRVKRWTTRRRPPATSGRSKSERVLTSRSSPEITESSLDLRWICWFFFGSMRQPRDQSKKDHLKPRFEWKLPSHRRIFAVSSLDLRRICWFFFEFVWQPRDRSKKHHLIAIITRSAGFRVGPDGLSGWVGFWFLVDSPNEYIVAINFLLLQHIYHYIKAVIKISSDYCNEIFCYTKLPQNLLQQHTSTIAMILMLLQ